MRPVGYWNQPRARTWMLDDVGRFLLLLHTLKDFQKFRLDQLRSTVSMTRFRPKVRKRERSICLCPTIFEDKLRVPLAYKHIQTSCGFAAGMVFGIPAVISEDFFSKNNGPSKKT